MRHLTVYRVFSRLLILALLLLLGLARLGIGQQPSTSLSGKSKGIPQSRPSGMSTGAIHAPVKDSQLRPITAGGFITVPVLPRYRPSLTLQGLALRFSIMTTTGGLISTFSMALPSPPVKDPNL